MCNLPWRTPRWLMVSSASARTAFEGPRKTETSSYYYTSRLSGEPAEGVNDIHFHPVEPACVANRRDGPKGVIPTLSPHVRFTFKCG
jgi:hypothetical protein